MDNSQRVGFTFFISYFKMMEHLTMENKGKMLTAMCKYFFEEQDVHQDVLVDENAEQEALMNTVWIAVQAHLDSSIKHSHKGKAGAPANNKNAAKSYGFQMAKQSKNNQSPSGKEKIIVKTMSKDSLEEYPLLEEVREMWKHISENEMGVEEAQRLQNEVTHYRDTHSCSPLTEEDYVKFLVFWTAPLTSGKWTGHCKYMGETEKNHAFSVAERLNALHHSSLNSKIDNDR